MFGLWQGNFLFQNCNGLVFNIILRTLLGFFGLIFFFSFGLFSVVVPGKVAKHISEAIYLSLSKF